MRIDFYNNTNENVFKYIHEMKKLFRSFNSKKHFAIIFVDEEEIKELNKNYRKIDKVTDVISFANCDDEEMQDSKDLGEIFICVKRAYDQAKEYGHSPLREFLFLAVHGYLHLCGYDHQTKEDEDIMFKKQDDILNKFGIKR
jgi:probable rRNA maturation factor